MVNKHSLHNEKSNNFIKLRNFCPSNATSHPVSHLLTINSNYKYLSRELDTWHMASSPTE